MPQLRAIRIAQSSGRMNAALAALSKLTTGYRRLSPSSERKKLAKIASTPSMKQVADGSVSRSMRCADMLPNPAACHKYMA
jgi:hypothetical protein